MTFITKKSVPRRTFLRGAGAVLALPMLDSMIPAMSAASTFKKTPRLGFIYTGNGVILEQWVPKTTGKNFELSPILSPLAKFRDKVNVLSGLSHLEADTKGDGSGDHTRAQAAWLTGVHAYDRLRPGVEVKLATTVDQIAARHLGKDTQLPSLEMSVDAPSQGACDAGDCFYVNTVSWRNETTPNQVEMHPRVVFERLFGDGGSAAQRTAQVKSTGSILDSVSEEAARLAGTLGNNDKGKLNEYLDSVREIESRIQKADAAGAQWIDLPDRPTDIPDSMDKHVKLMFDLQVLAFQADITRVFSLIMARELSLKSYGFAGVPDSHHGVSHHRDDPALIAKKAKIDTFHIEMVAYFLDKMSKVQDGDGGSLLDQSLLMYGGGLGNGNLHRHNDLPTLLIGNLGGKLKTGYHNAYKMDTPMSNLLVTILDKVGVPGEKIGDSTGKLPLQGIEIG